MAPKMSRNDMVAIPGAVGSVPDPPDTVGDPLQRKKRKKDKLIARWVEALADHKAYSTLTRIHEREAAESRELADHSLAQVRFLEMKQAKWDMVEARRVLRGCSTEGCPYTEHTVINQFMDDDGMLVFCCQRCQMQDQKKKHGRACEHIMYSTYLSHLDPEEWHEASDSD